VLFTRVQLRAENLDSGLLCAQQLGLVFQSILEAIAGRYSLSVVDVSGFA
jgi:hypothetical protein